MSPLGLLTGETKKRNDFFFAVKIKIKLLFKFLLSNVGSLDFVFLASGPKTRERQFRAGTVW